MTDATIFSTYEPIARYIRLIGAGYTPAVQLPALDAFLMSQIAACYPVPPTLIDWSASATLGASAVLWLASEGAAQVFVIDDRPTGQAEWRQWISAYFDLFPSDLTPHSYLDGLHTPEQVAAEVAAKRNPLSPVMLSLSITPDQADDAEVAALLKRIVTMPFAPIVFVSPLGAVGASVLIKSALDVCSDLPVRFAMLREVSPFFAMSQLGVLYPDGSTEIPRVFSRLRERYAGNFDYLTLLEGNLSSQIRVGSAKTRELESAMITSQEQALMTTLLPPGPIQSFYHRLVPTQRRLALRQIRENVLKRLRRGYQVAVPTPIRLAFRDLRGAVIKR